MEAGRTRAVSSGGAELFVSERGPPDAPAIVLVHGYPDTHAVWDELASGLAERFHVVAYDVRGMGRSTAPNQQDAFALEHLALDLGAVLDAVCPDRPVHLVGHDWGAFQCWEAITRDPARDRVASFTAIAGPRLDRSRDWARRRLRPSAAALAQLAGQARRSWYIAAFQLPGLPERALGGGFERAWPALMRRLEGIEPRPGHPAETLARDARTGLSLYRVNLSRVARRAARGPATVPVQLLVPTRDRYISPAVYDEGRRWATQVWRRDVRAGHWMQRSHPELTARFVAELVDHAEGAPEPPSLRRAQLTGDHGELLSPAALRRLARLA